MSLKHYIIDLTWDPDKLQINVDELEEKLNKLLLAHNLEARRETGFLFKAFSLSPLKKATPEAMKTDPVIGFKKVINKLLSEEWTPTKPHEESKKYE